MTTKPKTKAQWVHYFASLTPAKARALVKRADAAYYVERGRGKAAKPIMPDAAYDLLRARLEKLDPKAAKKVGATPNPRDAARRNLPIVMGSLTKITPEDVSGWCASIAKRSSQTMWLLTPKLDGVSLLLCYTDGKFTWAYTRGDGSVGRDVTAAARHVQGVRATLAPCSIVPKKGVVLIRCEVVMHKSIFAQHYADRDSNKAKVTYQNPRNLVAGLLNRADPSEVVDDLRRCTAVAIQMWRRDARGWRRPLDRHCEVVSLAATGLTPVTNPARYTRGHYAVVRLVKKGHPLKDLLPVIAPTNVGKLVYFDKPPGADEIKQRLASLADVLDVDIDGGVIEPCASKVFQDAGEHLEARPGYVRAVKLDPFEQESVTARIKRVDWEVSKRGLVKPTITIDPVRLRGVDVTSFTANNARQVRLWGYRAGVTIRFIRSGDVIPRVIGVRQGSRWVRVDNDRAPSKPIGPSAVPTKCPVCGSGLRWVSTNDVGCVNRACRGAEVSKVVAFFRILGADDVGPGVVSALSKAGMRTIPQVLVGATPARVARLPGYGQKSGVTVGREVAASLTDKPIALVMHASGVFQEAAYSLGEARLRDIVGVVGEDNLPSLTQKRAEALLYDKKGVGPETAKLFVRRLPEWQRFWASVKKFVRHTKRQTLRGSVVAFTGFRDAEMEKFVTSRGGSVGGVSKKTTVLFAAALGSTKANKAQTYGVPVVVKSEAWGWLKKRA